MKQADDEPHFRNLGSRGRTDIKYHLRSAPEIERLVGSKEKAPSWCRCWICVVKMDLIVFAPATEVWFAVGSMMISTSAITLPGRKEMTRVPRNPGVPAKTFRRAAATSVSSLWKAAELRPSRSGDQERSTIRKETTIRRGTSEEKQSHQTKIRI